VGTPVTIPTSDNYCCADPKLHDIHRHEQITRIQDQISDVFLANGGSADKTWEGIVKGLDKLGFMNSDVKVLCEQRKAVELLSYIEKANRPVTE